MKRVRFTHQSAADYAKVQLTGLYLYAARILDARLAGRRDEIATLVDFGCGAGKSTRAAAGNVRRGGEVIGVDVSAAMLAEAERLTPAADWPEVRFRFRRIEQGRIPLADGVADAVVTCAVLQELQSESELAAALAEIGRITRAGGTFVGVVPNDHLRDEDFFSLTYAPYPENRTRTDNIRQCRSNEAPIVWESDRHWSKETYARLLTAAGFEVRALDYPLCTPEEPPDPRRPELTWKGELRVAPGLVLEAVKRGG